MISFQTGGSTGTKDLAVAIVRYGPIDPFWASIKDLKLWSPPAGTDASLKTYTDANVSKFTEIGYGDTGTPHYTGGVQDGFNKQTSAGIQRFQNNNRSAVNVNAAHGTYTYTDFTWNPGPVSPGQPNLGTGTSFTGDSGGPYFMTDTVTKTITGLTDVLVTRCRPRISTSTPIRSSESTPSAITTIRSSSATISPAAACYSAPATSLGSTPPASYRSRPRLC